MVNNPLQDFIGYLLKGLSVVVQVMGSVSFNIYNQTITALDLIIYSGIIAFTLGLINKMGTTGVLDGIRNRHHSRNEVQRGWYNY